MKTSDESRKNYLKIICKKLTAEKIFLLANKKLKLKRAFFSVTIFSRKNYFASIRFNSLQNFFQNFLLRNFIQAIDMAETANAIEARLAVELA